MDIILKQDIVKQQRLPTDIFIPDSVIMTESWAKCPLVYIYVCEYRQPLVSPNRSNLRFSFCFFVMYNVIVAGEPMHTVHQKKE